MKITYSMCVG
jgi:hypothetical protein